jgi:hypothetical protein
LDSFAARKVAADKLREIGLLEKEEPYTNDVGFFEILRTGKLWMSDARSLNDPLEIEYGMKELQSALEEARTQEQKEELRVDKDASSAV